LPAGKYCKFFVIQPSGLNYTNFNSFIILQKEGRKPVFDRLPAGKNKTAEKLPKNKTGNDIGFLLTLDIILLY
jgi:hypothetical protein